MAEWKPCPLDGTRLHVASACVPRYLVLADMALYRRLVDMDGRLDG